MLKQYESESCFYSVILAMFCAILASGVENDFGHPKFGVNTICVSKDFSPSEEAIIEKSIKVWNFKQTHFVLGCDFNSILVSKDKQEHLQTIIGMPISEGRTVGLTQYFPKRVLISDTLDANWFPLIMAHEAGHLIYVDHILAAKGPAIMNDFISPEKVSDNPTLAKIDMIEYCKVWKCN